MNEFLVVLNGVLPVFAVAGAGILMRKLNWLTEEADQSLLRVTINLLAPCLIFDSILKNEALQHPGNVLVAPLVGFSTVILGLVAGMAMGRRIGLATEAEKRTFALSSGVYNYGYLALPLALLLFDQETVGVLLVHNVGVEAAYWTFGLALLGSQSFRSGWKKIFNPPLIAIIIALLINFSDASVLLPKALLNGIKMLGQCAIPMGLILIGAIMADHLHNFHTSKSWRVMLASCLLRLGILPPLFLLLAKFLPVPTELKRVIVLQAAMPAAVFTIVMAKHYSGDPATALRVVIGTSALSLLTIPFWIRVGLKWVGL